MNHPERTVSRQALKSIFAVCALLAGTGALAQTVAPNVAVPFYTPGTFMDGVYRYWYGPQSADFAAQSAALPASITAYCDAGPGAARTALQDAREQWKKTAAAWDRLAGVQVGPMLLRRSSREIDFSPTRPELINRAIQKAPADVAAMETVGTPGKGLPALEYLLWTKTAPPASAACRYAAVAAAEVAGEGQALATGFGDLAKRDLAEDEETSVPGMSELVNQWVGGIERLRWSHMEKPRMSSAQGAGSAGGYPRSASGQTGAAWAGEWQALRTLTVSRDHSAPAAGKNVTAIVPLETYLRGRGLNPLANKLAQSVEKTDKLMQNLSPNNAAGMQQASKSLGELKKLAEGEIATALNVNIGFSDADGD
ncbi:MAG: hypothetical protein EOO28_35165 [Comamonadaceae bacterium]|nr:MAG: hypothetical protein EOO28_35165 [Comamonadaceae bacterium]